MDNPAPSSSAHPPIFPFANRLVRPFFVIAGIALVILSMLSDAIYDIGDGIVHFQIAKWSWKHPELLLHHWGKPVFTLIASLPAQFGYKGLVLFNVLLHVATAWLTWRVADRMKLPFAWLAGPLVIFAPICWGVAQSGLTEPLFAFTLIFGIYFMTGARYKTAAIIISLLPFVRTEGILLVPVFGLFFLIRKEYFPMLLLGGGTLVYSVIGGLFVHHDFFWVLHQNPYKGEEDYGHGTLFHFVDQSEFIFGWAITALILPGLISGFFRKKFTPVHSLAEIVLVAGSFVIFFAAHSIFWWKGLYGSYGLTRVMVCVMPCAVIIALRGLHVITLPMRSVKIAVASCAVLVMGLTMFNTFRFYGLVLQPTERQLIAEDVAGNLIANDLQHKKAYCGDPVMTLLLDKDPYSDFDWSDIGNLHWWNPEPETVVIWDAFAARIQHNVSFAEIEAMNDPTMWDEVLVVRSPIAGDSIPMWAVYKVHVRIQY